MKHCQQIKLCLDRTADCVPLPTNYPWAILLIVPQRSVFPTHSSQNTCNSVRHKLAFCKRRGNKFPQAEDFAAFWQNPTRASPKQSSDRITNCNAMRSPSGITDFTRRINSEAPEDGSSEVCRRDRIGLRISSNTITGTKNLPAVDTSASKNQRVTIRPVIAASGRIDHWCAAEFSGSNDKSAFQKATFVQVRSFMEFCSGPPTATYSMSTGIPSFR